MNKSGKDSLTKKKIIEASIFLFLKQGYEKTTIRQIINRAGVTTGSLYHFFPNKEEIVVHTISEIFSSLIKKADELARKHNNPSLGFSIEIALNFKLLEKYPYLIDIWHKIYESEKGSAHILNIGTDAAVRWFSEYCPGFTRDDYYFHTIALRGISLSFMSEVKYGRKIDPLKRHAFITRSAMKIFNVPEDVIESVVEKTGEILRDIDLSLEEFVK